MNLSFPDYKELTSEESLNPRYSQIVHTLICEKLNEINNNLEFNESLIVENLKIVGHKIHFYPIKDFVIINFDVVFFDFKFRIPMTISFDESGKYTTWESRYVGSIKRSEMMHMLNLDHFNDGQSYLEFYLNKSELEEGYEIVKHDYIKTPMSRSKTVTLRYFFDKHHKIKYRKFKTIDADTESETSYSFEDFENLETEHLFLMFLNHIINQKETVDTTFVNYARIDFNKPEWFKKVHNMFLNALTGDKRNAFLDYMKVIDMMTI